MSITELNNSISTEPFRPSRRQQPSLKIQTPVIHSDASQASWVDLALKRAFDIVSSLSALLVLAPFLLFVALLIKLDSPGPVLFKQTRWGKNCKTIKVYKFRSMRTDLCDVSGVAQTVKNDPRITRVGAILRRTNVDELPQLLNVLMGHMSVVGPRCHAIGMRAGGMLYEELVPEYHQRHAMRPGMTGLAQMRGLRGPTDRPAKARARIVSDLYYVGNFSIGMDIRIIAGTVVSELTRGKGF
ncbi:lipopolysaccharide/colanic/teichoic acid biosynthesis glycosyltransferase [Rhizobium leguminosarum]|uniref:sugar transferase n=1 Tax=Rhizobium leguminosarum TaxID=384 RepID=UPI0016116006|nr:sugar transferase [Rhizobium leguminosarum]MBB5666791.1 lipopolysaccharide/colanic/teichoic acid biosynthesis glycosyltransferase [Rhizobium leguminosarum]